MSDFFAIYLWGLICPPLRHYHDYLRDERGLERGEWVGAFAPNAPCWIRQCFSVFADKKKKQNFLRTRNTYSNHLEWLIAYHHTLQQK